MGGFGEWKKVKLEVLKTVGNSRGPFGADSELPAGTALPLHVNFLCIYALLLLGYFNCIGIHFPMDSVDQGTPTILCLGQVKPVGIPDEFRGWNTTSRLQ